MAFQSSGTLIAFGMEGRAAQAAERGGAGALVRNGLVIMPRVTSASGSSGGDGGDGSVGDGSDSGDAVGPLATDAMTAWAWVTDSGEAVAAGLRRDELVVIPFGTSASAFGVACYGSEFHYLVPAASLDGARQLVAPFHAALMEWAANADVTSEAARKDLVAYAVELRANDDARFASHFPSMDEVVNVVGHVPGFLQEPLRAMRDGATALREAITTSSNSGIYVGFDVPPHHSASSEMALLHAVWEQRAASNPPLPHPVTAMEVEEEQEQEQSQKGAPSQLAQQHAQEQQQSQARAPAPAPAPAKQQRKRKRKLSKREGKSTKSKREQAPAPAKQQRQRKRKLSKRKGQSTKSKREQAKLAADGDVRVNAMENDEAANARRVDRPAWTPRECEHFADARLRRTLRIERRKGGDERAAADARAVELRLPMIAAPTIKGGKAREFTHAEWEEISTNAPLVKWWVETAIFCLNAMLADSASADGVPVMEAVARVAAELKIALDHACAVVVSALQNCEGGPSPSGKLFCISRGATHICEVFTFVELSARRDGMYTALYCDDHALQLYFTMRPYVERALRPRYSERYYEESERYQRNAAKDGWELTPAAMIQRFGPAGADGKYHRSEAQMLELFGEADADGKYHYSEEKMIELFGEADADGKYHYSEEKMIKRKRGGNTKMGEGKTNVS